MDDYRCASRLSLHGTTIHAVPITTYIRPHLALPRTVSLDSNKPSVNLKFGSIAYISGRFGANIPSTCRLWQFSGTMGRPPRLRRAQPRANSFILLTILLHPVSTRAQIINPTQVPACISSCTNVIAAQNLCVPPVTPAPNTVCFCNSNYLVPLKNGQITGVCDNICQPADMQTFLTYYQSLCANAQAPAAPAAPATTTITSTSTPTATSASSTGNRKTKKQSWYTLYCRLPVLLD